MTHFDQWVTTFGWEVSVNKLKIINTHQLSSGHRNDLRIIERDEWGAEEPTEKDFLNLPAQNVIIYHTATEQCETKVM